MEDKATLQELRERYLVDRRWKDLVDVLQREIRVTEDREERLDLYELLGSVYAEHLDDAERAFDAFRTVIDLRDEWSDEEALGVYEQLLDIDPEFGPAFERVDEIYRRRGDAASLENLAGRYIDLADAASDDTQAFLRHQREAARIFEEQLHNPQSALIVLISSVGPETWHTGILEDIERLATKTGAWDEAIETLLRVAKEMTVGQPFARLQRRIGQWMIRAGRPEAAEHLRAALEHFPDDGETERVLSELLRQEGRYADMVEAADMRRQRAAMPEQQQRLRRELLDLLEEAAANTEGAERAGFLAHIGSIHENELSDRLTAVRYWERALNAEPDTLAAARPLIDHYMADNRWDRAAPVLEGVIKAAEASRGLLDPEELNQRYIQYGRVLDEVGNEKLALHAYRQAYELDRTNPKTLERLGLLLYEASEYDQAYHVFIQLADRHERAVRPEVLLDVLRKAASIKNQFGDYRVAMGLIDSALRLKGDDREALKLAAEIAEASGEKALAVRAREKLIASETDPTVKFAELVRMGDAFIEGGDQVQAGAKAYVAALEIDPKSVSVLRKLLDAFRLLERWREAIGVLERLVGHENEGSKRAHLFYTMGILARDQVGAPERAVGYFEQALDEDPELLKAFEAIDRILTDAKAWKDLERAYRRMLHRVAATDADISAGKRDDLNHLLWTAIGEVYRSRLGDLPTAVEAFEAALGIRPDDEKVRMILAELYEKTGSNTDGAVAQHRALLEKDPLRADSYHVLFRAFLDQRRFDAAFCVAGLLDWLEKAEWDESDYYRKYLGMNLRLAQGQFYPELLDRVYPRGQNRIVNAMMAHLAVALREFFAHPVKDFGVHPKKDLIRPEEQGLLISQMFHYVARTLSFAPAPLLYARTDHPLGLRILNTDPPAMLVGSDMLQDVTDDRATVFRLAKLLAWMRPELYLAAVGNGPQELLVIFTSALDWATGRNPSAGREGATIIKRIKASSSQTQMQLQSLARTYLQHATGPPDIASWLTNAEHATSRFGLILCGDIHTAVNSLKMEPQAMTTASMKERVKSLAAYSASEDYFKVREELGLAIG